MRADQHGVLVYVGLLVLWTSQTGAHGAVPRSTNKAWRVARNIHVSSRPGAVHVCAHAAACVPCPAGGPAMCCLRACMPTAREGQGGRDPVVYETVMLLCTHVPPNPPTQPGKRGPGPCHSTCQTGDVDTCRSQHQARRHDNALALHLGVTLSSRSGWWVRHS